MGADRRHWKLFVRYLAGECSEREQAEVLALIAVDEEKARLFDELRKIADASATSSKHLDAEMAWRDLDQRLQQGARITKLSGARPHKASHRVGGGLGRSDRRSAAPSAGRTHRRRAGRGARFQHSAIMAAVVFTAVIIGTIIAVNLTVSPEVSEQEPNFKIFATKKGERATVHLADGSRVILNADSRLTVPGNFRDGDRSVQFEGQGYFDVASIEERPFIVQTTLADVRVLGTEFDVDAHAEAAQMQVVVKTGEVSVRSNHLDEAESIILRPRDLGIVLQAGGQLVRRNIDVDRYIAWREGRLVFENASFKEVAKMLERWYDLSVQLQNPSENVDGLTATFEDEPVDEVLNVIAAALNLNYRRDGKSVTFHPAP